MNPIHSRAPITPEQLNAALAHRVFGWRVGPDRFQLPNRGWIPRGRFRPAELMQDAFKPLLAAHPDEYRLIGGKG